MKFSTYCFALSLFVSTISAQAVFVQYSGSGTGNGSVDETGFSNADWTLEFGVDTTTVDSQGDTDQGEFSGAIVSGALTLDSTTYTLTSASTSGRIVLINRTDVNDNGAIFAQTTNGGVSFNVGQAAMVPSVFTDPNSLGSLIAGSSVSNTLVDGHGSSSYLGFELLDGKSGQTDGRLVSVGGGLITFTATAASGSGAMTVAISNTSMVSAVPEPAQAGLLMALGGFSLVLLRRRRRSTHG